MTFFLLGLGSGLILWLISFVSYETYLTLVAEHHGSFQIRGTSYVILTESEYMKRKCGEK